MENDNVSYSCIQSIEQWPTRTYFSMVGWRLVNLRRPFDHLRATTRQKYFATLQVEIFTLFRWTDLKSNWPGIGHR